MSAKIYYLKGGGGWSVLGGGYEVLTVLVLFGVPLYDPKMDPNFDNSPCVEESKTALGAWILGLGYLGCGAGCSAFGIGC